MLYNIIIDSTYTISNDRKKCLTAVLEESTNSANSLALSVSYLEKYDFIPMHTKVEVKNDKNELMFKGRLISVKAKFNGLRELSFEGELAKLNDVQFPTYNHRGSPKEFLTSVLNYYNSKQTSDYDKFYTGNVTVTDSNDTIVRSNEDFSTCWEAIKTKLLDMLGGYLKLRYVNGYKYLDYEIVSGKVASQTVEFGKNLLDLENYIDATNVATVLIPLGARIEEETTGKETSEDKYKPAKYVTIESVNGGKNYLETNLISQYGRIESKVQWEDVTEPQNLLEKAKKYLIGMVLNDTTFTVKAVDFANIDGTYTSYQIGDIVTVNSKPHNVSKSFILTTRKRDLFDIAKDTLEFTSEDKEVKSSSKTISQSFQALAKTSSQVVGNLQAIKVQTQLLDADVANIKNAYVKRLDADTIIANNIKANKETVDYLNSKYATVENLNANNATIEDIKATYLKTKDAEINYAKIDFSNVNNAMIENGNIRDGYISSAMISSLVANKITGGTLDASKVNVTNLNATSINTGKLTVDGVTIDFDNAKTSIQGAVIDKGSISLDKLEDSVKNAIDGAIETYTGEEVPTLMNYPFNTWSETEKPKHVGDIYYIINKASPENGFSYRLYYDNTTGQYEWILIKDSDVTKAIQDINKMHENITSFKEEYHTFKDETDEGIENLIVHNTQIETSLNNKVETSTFNAVKNTVDENSSQITTVTNSLQNDYLTKTETESLIKQTNDSITLSVKNYTDSKVDKLQNTFLHIRYSNDGGKTFTANNGKTDGDYIGHYSDNLQEDSNDPNKYAWSKTKRDVINLAISTTNGNMFKNSSIATILVVSVFFNGIKITDFTTLQRLIGYGTYLKWKIKNFGEDEFHYLDDNDNRISDGGFMLSITPTDIQTQAVFDCELYKE